MKTPTNPFTFGNAMRVSLAACALIMPSVSAMAEKIHVSTPSTSLVLDGEKGGDLKFLYYGAALNPAEIDALGNAGMKELSAFPFTATSPSMNPPWRSLMPTAT